MRSATACGCDGALRNYPSPARDHLSACRRLRYNERSQRITRGVPYVQRKSDGDFGAGLWAADERLRWRQIGNGGSLGRCRRWRKGPEPLYMVRLSCADNAAKVREADGYQGKRY